MSTEQPNEDGKIDVQINFHRLPFALRSDPLIVAALCVVVNCARSRNVNARRLI